MNAQVGQSGIPVVCKVGVPPTITSDLTCRLPDGSTFTTVPASNYLLVTDFYITAPANTYSVGINMRDVSSFQPIDTITFTGGALENRSEHFTTPLFVLRPGWRLEAYTTGTGGSVMFQVTGLLSTNYSYLPMIVR